MGETRVSGSTILSLPEREMKILEPVWEWWGLRLDWTLWKFGFALGLRRGRKWPIRVYEVGCWFGPLHVHGGQVYPVEFVEGGNEGTDKEDGWVKRE